MKDRPGFPDLHPVRPTPRELALLRRNLDEAKVILRAWAERRMMRR